MTECPIARYGCISKLPHDSLLEHYSSQIHQETLLKAIEAYVRELHNKPCDNHPQITFENEEYSNLIDSVNMLAEGLSCLQDDNVQLHTSHVQLTSTLMDQQKQIEQLKKSTEETTRTVDATQISSNILQTDIEAMKQMLSDLSSQSSNDGSYIWKITDVAEKMASSMSEHQTSIYSPPFYSSPSGYKMCMRLYLNGDGNARNTHISLFFVIMRGNYDPILVWPFNYKITFILYDQTSAQRHVIDSFRPDVKSNSFQVPRSNMNIASGLPKFFPLSIFRQDNNPYVRDNSIFIRCMVDFRSIPKPCIPYMVNLNPGLPLAVQQEAIQGEIQKYKTTITMEASTVDSSKKIDELKVIT